MVALVLLQSVKWEVLVRLTESQLTIVNTQLETELLTNETIKRELGNKAKELTKGLGGGPTSA